MAITYRITKGSALDYAEMDENFQTLEDKDTAQDADIANVALAKMGGDAFMHVQDQKPQGTSGGNFTSGAWRTRDLNTVLTNTITGASLDSNQITLPTGKYYVEALTRAYVVGNHVAKIYDISNSSDVFTGFSTYASETRFQEGIVSIAGIFQVGASADFELQHRSGFTNTNNGFGRPCSLATEVYSDIRIWRIGDYVAP